MSGDLQFDRCPTSRDACLAASFQQVSVGLAHPPSVAINTLPSLVKEKTHGPKVRPFLDKKMSNIHQVLPPALEGSEPGDKSTKSLSESRWRKFYWSAGETVALSTKKVAKSILSSKYYKVKKKTESMTVPQRPQTPSTGFAYPACTPSSVN